MGQVAACTSCSDARGTIEQLVYCSCLGPRKAKNANGTDTNEWFAVESGATFGVRNDVPHALESLEFTKNDQGQPWISTYVDTI